MCPDCGASSGRVKRASGSISAIPRRSIFASPCRWRACSSRSRRVSSSAAFAAAPDETLRDRAEHARPLQGLAKMRRRGSAEVDPDARFTLPEEAPQSGHIVHVVFPGADADSLLFLLDERGVDSSAGSACSAGVTQASPVLAAMGLTAEQTRGALRLSLGWTSTERDIEILLRALPESLEKARTVGALFS